VEQRFDTVTQAFVETSRSRAADPAFSRLETDGWVTLTWGEAADRAARIATGMRELGVGKGDRVVLMTRNRPEFNVCDAAALLAGATPFSIYSSSSPEQVQYLAGHSEASLAIVEDAGYLERFSKVRSDLPALKNIIVIDHDGVTGETIRLEELLDNEPIDADRAVADASAEDLLTLVYTSGTTGPPKGAMILHRNICWTHASFNSQLADQDWAYHGKGLSYLPLAHVLERWYAHYYPIFNGYSVWHCPEPSQLAQFLPQVRPDFFVGVPRVWEKLRAGIEAAVASNEAYREPFERAMAAGYERLSYDERREPLPDDVRARWDEAAGGALAMVRALVGLDNCKIAGVGAAPVPDDLLRFWRALGVLLSEGFGMTETSFIATYDVWQPKIGYAGRTVPGMEMKLAGDGELLLRGGNVIPGYFKDPERTAHTFDADGWLLTGDIAEIDDEGYLRIVDRKKELIITAGGKNISPANIEAVLKSFPLIGQACVIGDDKPFLTALLVLDPDGATAFARANGLSATSLQDLSKDPTVLGEVERSVAEANARFSRVEQIKKYTLLPNEWLPDSEELTPTMKLKRRGVHKSYAAEITAMYD
jgi:long-subunit acyl-CoA synthetase (AMP-forming)